MTTLTIFMFEGQLMQMPSPGDIYRSNPLAYLQSTLDPLELKLFSSLRCFKSVSKLLWKRELSHLLVVLCCAVTCGRRGTKTLGSSSNIEASDYKLQINTDLITLVNISKFDIK